MDRIEKDFKRQLDVTLEHFETELGKIRTGRANPMLLEDVKVDYYGTLTPLKQVASISTPGPRMLLVQPWDKNSAAAVEKAIQKSGLGLNPTNEGDKIRLILPALTEETRREMVQLVREKKEEAKVAVRNHREEAVEEASAQEGISEDQIETTKEAIQTLVNQYNDAIAQRGKTKEKEIMTI